jgi:hypothetical protein
MVVFNAEAVDKEQDEPGENRSMSLQESAVTKGYLIWPTIGAFTVQCAKCFKWRLFQQMKSMKKFVNASYSKLLYANELASGDST